MTLSLWKYIGMMLFTFFFLLSKVNAQNPSASILDSLQTTLLNADTDSSKHQTYLSLIDHAIKADDLASSQIIEDAIKHAQNVQQDKSQALIEVYYATAISLNTQGQIEKSDKYLSKVLEENQKEGSDLLLAESYYNLGLNAQHAGKTDEALKYYENSISIHQKKGAQLGIAKAKNSLSTLYRNKGEIAIALKLLDEAASILKKTEDKILLAAVYNSMGRIYRGQSSFDTAGVYYQLSLDLSTEVDHKKSMAVAYNNLGNVYQSKGDLSKALESYIRSLKIKEVLGNPKSISIAYHNVGSVRTESNNFDLAKKDFEKSMQYAEACNFKLLKIHNYKKLGDIARSLNDLETALENHTLAFKLSKEMDFKSGLSEATLNLGKDYLLKKDYKKGLTYFIESLEIAEALGKKRGISLALSSIAEAYIQIEKEVPQSLVLENAKYGGKEQIEDLLLRAYSLGEETGDLNSMNTSLTALITFYQKQGNFREEVKYARKYIGYRDSLFNYQKANALADFETQYETAEKEKEIALLEKEQALNEKERNFLARQNKYFSAIVGGLLAFLLLLYYLFYQVRKTKRQIESQNIQLQQLNTTKDKFFGIIAHDIRSPIIALDGVGEQMDFYLKKGNQEKLERLASRVDSTAKRLGALLDNLLNWALLQQGVIPYHPKGLNVKQIVEHTLDMFQHNALAKGIDLKSTLDPNLVVFADEPSLNTILRNLVSNAIKFTPSGGEVTILAAAKAKQITIEIQDTGTGVPKAKLNQLFTLEKQSKKGTAGEKGTGLGLSLVKELVDLNKGTIEVTSQVGKGSIFSIQFEK